MNTETVTLTLIVCIATAFVSASAARRTADANRFLMFKGLCLVSLLVLTLTAGEVAADMLIGKLQFRKLIVIVVSVAVSVFGTNNATKGGVRKFYKSGPRGGGF